LVLQAEKQFAGVEVDDYDQPKRGLGGHLVWPNSEEDTEMPDIRREKFPDGTHCGRW
jgi:hypothetical protein